MSNRQWDLFNTYKEEALCVTGTGNQHEKFVPLLLTSPPSHYCTFLPHSTIHKTHFHVLKSDKLSVSRSLR